MPTAAAPSAAPPASRPPRVRNFRRSTASSSVSCAASGPMPLMWTPPALDLRGTVSLRVRDANRIGSPADCGSQSTRPTGNSRRTSVELWRAAERHDRLLDGAPGLQDLLLLGQR